MLFNQNAPHITTVGTISGVRIHTGKGSSTSFNLSTAPGVRLELSGAHQAVAEGERASVTYQAGSGTVLNLTIQGGSNDSVEIRQSDGSSLSILAILAGLILALFGLSKWRNDPNATPRPAPADKNAPPDVDQQSLLHLENRD